MVYYQQEISRKKQRWLVLPPNRRENRRQTNDKVDRKNQHCAFLCNRANHPTHNVSHWTSTQQEMNGFFFFFFLALVALFVLLVLVMINDVALAKTTKIARWQCPANELAVDPFQPTPHAW